MSSFIDLYVSVNSGIFISLSFGSSLYSSFLSWIIGVKDCYAMLSFGKFRIGGVFEFMSNSSSYFSDDLGLDLLFVLII